METRVLNYFLTIARLGTVSAAARELHVAQPTLSRQIQQLEQELGTQLFTRERRRMILTKAGIAYQSRIQHILTELDQANEIVADINNRTLTGTIRIGCVQSSIHKFLIPALAAFQKRYPAVAIQFYDADGSSIKEQLDGGSLDLGVVSTPISTAKYHDIHLPVDDQWGIAVTSENPLANKKGITIDDLKNTSVMIPHRTLIKSELDDWLQPIRNQMHLAGESNLIGNAAYLTAATNAALICIKGAPRPADCNLHFIPFTPTRPQKHFLIWRKGVTLSEPVTRFITQVDDQVADS